MLSTEHPQSRRTWSISFSTPARSGWRALCLLLARYGSAGPAYESRLPKVSQEMLAGDGWNDALPSQLLHEYNSRRTGLHSLQWRPSDSQFPPERRPARLSQFLRNADKAREPAPAAGRKFGEGQTVILHLIIKTNWPVSRAARPLPSGVYQPLFARIWPHAAAAFLL
jgi:hypothetical protein